jgi:pyruvate-formate lyase-activating enzyme
LSAGKRRLAASEKLFGHSMPSSPIVIGQNATTSKNSPNRFENYKFEKASIPDLLRFARQHRTSPAEFLPLIEVLNRQPAGAFESLRSAYVHCHNENSEPSPKCIKVMRDLLLASVDQRLQNIYRKHFHTYPQHADAAHEQKIESLEVTRGDVAAVLDSYDWYWLADWLDLGGIGETAETCVRQLGNFAFPMRRVNFRFTYHCNIACRHCYNSSGPHRKADRLSLETMLAIVAEMPEAGISHLNLSGGEPFLYQNELLALVAAGRAARLDGISIYTNGFWASTDERAARVLDRLAASAFMRGPGDHIKVSGGIYHQEFIAFERILILARNYYARFGQRLAVDIELPPQAGDFGDEVRCRISAAGLDDQIRLLFRAIGSLGRANDIEEIPRGTMDPLPCNVINQIAFDPDGSVRPCCGANGEHHGIVIGPPGQRHRLKNLAKRMQNDPVLQFIGSNPMSEIFAYLPTATKKAGHGGRCDLCMDTLGSLTNKEPLQAKLFDRQKFYPFWFSLNTEQKRAKRGSPNRVEARALSPISSAAIGD